MDLSLTKMEVRLHRRVWFKGDSINLGIGQGYISTHTNFTGYSSNSHRGDIIKPRLVEEIMNHLLN